MSPPETQTTNCSSRPVTKRPPNKDLSFPPNLLVALTGGTNNPSTALTSFRSLIYEQSLKYLCTRPGDANSASNSDLEQYILLVMRKRCTRDTTFGILRWIQESTAYRLKLQKLATSYTGILRIQGRPGICETADMVLWECMNERDGAMMERWSFAGDAIWKSGILPEPREEQGHDYLKPELYLAACMAVAKWDQVKVKETVAQLVIYGLWKGFGKTENGELGDYDVIDRSEGDDSDEDMCAPEKKMTWGGTVKEGIQDVARSLRGSKP